MSISAFKANLTNYLNKPENVKDSDDFATFLTREYDTLIKSGFQTINSIPIMTSNVSGMESNIKSVLKATLNVTVSPTPIIQNLGPGFITYWTGAQLLAGPPPIIPAIGAVSNVSSVSNPVLNPGTWVVPSPQAPSDSVNPFVSVLISTIQTHLTTISGLYNTLSIYPAPPGAPPAPGVLPWVGYTVP
jgi:hypothetical protein